MSLLDSLLEADLITPPLANGTQFQREIWICRRTDGGTQLVFGAGTQDDPYDGSTADKLDTILASIAFAAVPNPTVRIGPGVFETRGGVGGGWFAKNGRIIGSGMFVTTLKLIGVATAGELRPIVRNAAGFELGFFELSDLTLDCNIDGQPNSPGYSYPRVCVIGINLGGSNIAVRRVRCINWGTQTPLFEYNASPRSLECFPIFVGGGGNNAVIEDCIIEQPSPNPARETTCLSAVSTNAVIRNCLVNGTINGASTNPVSINNVSIAALGGTPAQWRVTLDFDAPHNKTASSRILLVIYKDGDSNNPCPDTSKWKQRRRRRRG